MNVLLLRRGNHGIQTCYEYGEDIGGMERSRYFGRSLDLYVRFVCCLGLLLPCCSPI